MSTDACRRTKRTGIIVADQFSDMPITAIVGQPGVVSGAVFEFHAARAYLGLSPGTNDPMTTTAFDTTETGNDGSLVNCDGTEWGGTGTLADPHALTLNGTDEYLALPDLGAAEDKVYTYEAWVKIDAIPAGWSLVLAEGRPTDATSGQSFLAVEHTAGKPVIALVDDAGSDAYHTGPASVCDGEPHHLVGTSNGTKVQLYVDGSAIASPKNTPAGVVTLGYTTMGAYRKDAGPVVSNNFPGSIIVARIYPFGLSAANVATNLAAGYTWNSYRPTKRTTHKGVIVCR